MRENIHRRGNKSNPARTGVNPIQISPPKFHGGNAKAIKTPPKRLSRIGAILSSRGFMVSATPPRFASFQQGEREDRCLQKQKHKPSCFAYRHLTQLAALRK